MVVCFDGRKMGSWIKMVIGLQFYVGVNGSDLISYFILFSFCIVFHYFPRWWVFWFGLSLGGGSVS